MGELSFFLLRFMVRLFIVLCGLCYYGGGDNGSGAILFTLRWLWRGLWRRRRWCSDRGTQLEFLICPCWDAEDWQAPPWSRCLLPELDPRRSPTHLCPMTTPSPSPVAPASLCCLVLLLLPAHGPVQLRRLTECYMIGLTGSTKAAFCIIIS